MFCIKNMIPLYFKFTIYIYIVTGLGYFSVYEVKGVDYAMRILAG
jgi:hypothetical protein